jgi:hypothetical protein
MARIFTVAPRGIKEVEGEVRYSYYENSETGVVVIIIKFFIQ